MTDFNQQVIGQFRSSGGVVQGFDDIVLLTTKGNKTGQDRTTPVVCQPGDDGVLYVFASFAGAPEDPAWFRNLVAEPKVHVEHKTDSFDALATVLDEPKRTEIYDRQAAALPTFAEYQEKTDRVIPVVALTPR